MLDRRDCSAMTYAFVSDIHANRQAWKAVLDDLPQRQVDVVLCLGDIVGYGPAPGEVFESVCEHCDGIVIGNHDAVVGGRCDPEIFNDDARRIIEWTRRQLGSDAEAMFADMHTDLEGDDFVAVHADIVEPDLFWYIENAEDAQVNFEGFHVPLMFVGHTHQAGLFVRDEASGIVAWHDPVDFLVGSDQRYIVNVGSVGDPRNAGETEGCYVTYDADARTIRYHRIPFAIDAYRTDLAKSGLRMEPPFLRAARARERTAAPDRTPGASMASEVSTAPRRPRVVSAADDAAAAAGNALAWRFERKRREAMELQQLAESLGVVAQSEARRLDVRALKQAGQPLDFSAIMDVKRRSWSLRKEQEDRENEARAKLAGQRKMDLRRTVEQKSRERQEREALARQQAERERERMRKALEQRQQAARERRKQTDMPENATRPADQAAPGDEPRGEAAQRREALQARIAEKQRLRETARNRQREEARQAIHRRRQAAGAPGDACRTDPPTE